MYPRVLRDAPDEAPRVVSADPDDARETSCFEFELRK
jgi:hypothetical protein